MIADSSGKPDRERALIGRLSGLKVAGLALAPSSDDETYLDLIQGLKIPTACFAHRAPAPLHGYDGERWRGVTLKLGGIIARRILHRIMSPDGAADPAQDFVLAPKFMPGTSCKRLS